MTVKYIKIQGEKILMKDKKINIISPAVAIIVAILDLAVLGYGIFAAVKLVEQFSSLSIIFAVIEVFALVIAVLVSKEVLSNGVIFRDDEAEFTGVDDNNIITYEDVREIEAYKDTAASLTKNFDMRHALIMFTMKDKKVNTIDLGLMPNSTINKILDEFRERTNAKSINFNQVKKADIFVRRKKDDGNESTEVEKEENSEIKD